MATIRTICTQSLQRLNAVAANSVPSSEDIDIAAETLNVLIDSLSNSILNTHFTTEERFLITANKQSYTLGPEFDSNGDPTGADWVTTRPMRIENAVIMVYPALNNTSGSINGINYDQQTMFFPLQMLTYSEFSSLTIRKLQTTWPTCAYDNNGYPLRTIELWPVPNMSMAIDLWMWQPLNTYLSLDDELSLPPGYERYFILKLAMELAPTFSKPVTETLTKSLIEAEKNIKAFNQMPTVSQASNAAQALSKRTPKFVMGDSKSTRIPRAW